MRRLISVGITLGILTASYISTSTLASADTKCRRTDPRTGVCLIVAADPGHGGNRRAGTEVGSISGSGSGASDDACQLNGQKVPCEQDGGIWSNSHRCYLKLMADQPPKSDPAWEGHTTGNLYQCFLAGDPDFYPVWLATAPGAAPPPDPRVLALRAIESMRLSAIRIGVVPESAGGSVGVIGLPTWMWVAQPDQHTWGPITKTAGAGGFSVTATAKVQRIVWSMGDGSTVTCTTAGTPYADRYGKRSSPDCGYTFTRQGTYTVRATSYWIVTWSGIGQTGRIPLNFTRSAVITMGEAQVLAR